MKIWILFLSFVFSATVFADNLPTFEIEFRSDQTITLSFENNRYELREMKNGLILPNKNEIEQIPIDILIWIQFVYQFKQSDFEIEKTIRALSKVFQGSLSETTLIDRAIEIASQTQNRKALEQLLFRALSNDQRGLIYFYLSLLEKEWPLQKAFLMQALLKAPHHSLIRQGAQAFSLNMASGILESYEEQLLEAQIWRKFDMDGVKPTWPCAIKQTVMNTFQVSRLCFTDIGNQLQTEWELQLQQISTLKILIAKLQHQVSQGRDLQDIADLPQSPFFQDLVEKGIYTDSIENDRVLPYPLFSDFGLQFKEEFIDYHWSTIALGQLNLLNYWMFFRLPKQIKSFGKTNAGKWTVKTLRLESLVNRVSSLPRFLEPLAMWVIIETADGCIARWIYTGLITYSKLTREEEDRLREHIERQFDNFSSLKLK